MIVILPLSRPSRVILVGITFFNFTPLKNKPNYFIFHEVFRTIKLAANRIHNKSPRELVMIDFDPIIFQGCKLTKPNNPLFHKLFAYLKAIDEKIINSIGFIEISRNILRRKAIQARTFCKRNPLIPLRFNLLPEKLRKTKCLLFNF